MKKLSLVFAVIICCSFQTPQPKTFSVVGSLQQWQNVLKVIDYSKAEPEERIAAKNFIIAALQKQFADTTHK